MTLDQNRTRCKEATEDGGTKGSRTALNIRKCRAVFCSTLVPSDEVTIEYKHGLPVITVPLPSRQERCWFSVKPMLMTVGGFLQDIRNEDKGIDNIAVFTADDSKISAATLMEDVLRNEFKLVINKLTYHVQPPVIERMSSERAAGMEDVKTLVHKLYSALYLEEHQLQKERELLEKLDSLREQLHPLEQVKANILQCSEAKSTRLLWIGMAFMSTQAGALAWLTWWVYSWDIMEPVTYFLTYGTALGFYAYLMLTKQDYIYADAKDRQFLHYFHRRAKRKRFDVDKYNQLREEMEEVEEDLRRLRSSLHLHIPVQQINWKE
nr:PREDICTED: calcium uniporter regulatory subunit MCUb, mitochondrial isoform X1 [Latimeria chalumnae]XP_014346042.1 PREDICTED: calcium uniporter regulatory subunit MCUb, mitochondrial isoform X1 [Latimeria chalumnae]XP_014346043.1 PREDICTED: calcium uniporter regulatory subunit MCUb, mitochondrial isoform X1 [Latimeria chalumnae]|eukprot:XP_014346041.1 PREDICTED: calcium uniporter regulatory subunit MCUb, mitochondrial isoform X1 [Latimeria chalumnae]